MSIPLNIHKFCIVNSFYIPNENVLFPRFQPANYELGPETQILWAAEWALLKPVTNTSATPKEFSSVDECMDYYYSVGAADVLSQVNAIYGSGTYTLGDAVKIPDVYQDVIDESISDALDAYPQADWNQSDNAQKDFIKNKPSIPDGTRTISALSLPVSGTGATGTQISATKDSQICVTYQTQVTYSLSGSPVSNVTLKICATNSATEGDWTDVGQTEVAQPTGLAVTVGQVVRQKGQIVADIPAGWYVKAVNSGSGTHSESFVSGQKTIFG